MLIFKELGSFYLLSDHGFRDTKELKERYRHGGKTIWETVLPFVEINFEINVIILKDESYWAA